MGLLHNKVAVVTGGGTGIGRASCLAFAGEGAAVVVVSNVSEQAAAVAAEIGAEGGTAVPMTVDVTDVAAVEALAGDVESRFGCCDVLMTCAGVMGAREFITETNVEAWRTTIEVNLNAGFYCIKAFLPGMLARDSGRIITVSSASGKLPAARNADYAASKHGVIGLTKALALELGMLHKNGITANTLCPGPVATPMMDAIADHLTHGGDRAQFDRAATVKSIQRRYLDPSEIASMALYLASDAAHSITGQAINVDGGTVLF